MIRLNRPSNRPNLRPALLWLLAAAGVLLMGAPSAFSQADVPAAKLQITPEPANGIAAPGQTVRWTISVDGDAAGVSEFRYQIKPGGLNTLGEGSVDLVDGRAVIEGTLDKPGWLLLETQYKSLGKKREARSGIAFAPEKIVPAIARPEDFDAFWTAKVAQLRAIPANPVLTPGKSDRDGVEYALIDLDNINGSKVHGQVAVRSGGQKRPALLIVQWAGVYPLNKDWVTGRAGEGWLTLNIQAHDLPVTGEKAFFEEQAKGPLNNYPAIGCDDRETSYFLRMYLSCVRAVDYLKTRDDWDGETIVVHGGSQGGLQSIVTAALCGDDVTGIVANVPAGCDNASLDADRRPGWPMWPWMGGDGKDKAKVRETSRYYDVVNFASKVACPALIGIGGADVTCPPPGVYAAAGQMKGPVQVVFMPNASHSDGQDAFWPISGQWFDALLHGRTPPTP